MAEAAMGAGLAAITGGNIGQGALLGAITGAFFSGTTFFGEGLKGGMKILAYAEAGAYSGAIGAAAIGADPGRGAWIGALSGAAFGGIGNLGGKNWKWDLGRVALAGTAGGAISELAGGSFLDGFIFAGTIAGADFVYRSILSSQGRHGASMKPAEKKGQPKLDVDEKPLIGKDGKAIVVQVDPKRSNVGSRSKPNYDNSWDNLKNQLTGETGAVMDALGLRVPGFQGLSLAHDPLGNFIETTFGQTAWEVVNIPTMAPIYGLNLVGSAINDNPAYIGLHDALENEN